MSVQFVDLLHLKYGDRSCKYGILIICTVIIREMKHERLLIIMNFKIFFIVHPMIISCIFSDPMAYFTCYDICPCKFSELMAILHQHDYFL